MSTTPGVSLESITAAREAIAGVVRHTPVWNSLALEAATGHPIGLKCEQMQRTGSFKIRGATNFVSRLSPEDAARGLIAASAGNHAQGVALAASSRGIPVSVVMPRRAPLSKIAGTRDYGAHVILHGDGIDAARRRAQEIARVENRVYVPPYDHDDIISGQGTVGLEILEQFPTVTEVLVPAGGGGLLAGVATAIKAVRPGVRVVGVQAAAMDGIAASFGNAAPVERPNARTIADGVAVPGPSQRTLDLINRHVDEIVACTDDEIAAAIVLLIERSKMVVEGAGALAVAALHCGRYRPLGPTVAVISGGNIDINLLGSIVRRGLVEAGRYRRLRVEATDIPGELARLTTAVASEAGNILEVDHDREASGMHVGVTAIDLLVEVKGPAHFNRILNAVRAAGFPNVGES